MQSLSYCHVMELPETESGLIIGCIEHLQNVATNNCKVKSQSYVTTDGSVGQSVLE
jgi:hypothetical protein